MPEIKFPYDAWVLTPSFTPRKVEIVGVCRGGGWMRAQSNKVYPLADLFTTKGKAIEHGWRRLDEQIGALKKREEAINKKKVTLTKHSNP